MIPSAPDSWLKPISEKDKAAGKREHCVSVSLTLVSPKILTFTEVLMMKPASEQEWRGRFRQIHRVKLLGNKGVINP